MNANMREREELIGEWDGSANTAERQALFFEVLLDIRELLHGLDLNADSIEQQMRIK